MLPSKLLAALLKHTNGPMRFSAHTLVSILGRNRHYGIQEALLHKGQQEDNH